MTRLSVVWSPDYTAHDVPDDHRFPMGKYEAVARRLVADGIVPGFDAFHLPIAAPASWLELAHDGDYVAGVLNQSLPDDVQRRIGFKVTEPISRRARTSAAGTTLAARMALEQGAAASAAGGSHHASREGGAGFCVFNDVGVAASVLLAEGTISRALVIDLDVHQGDGTARIFEGDDRVFTLSLHCEKNWPRRKAQSDLDIGLPEGTGDADYLAALSDALDRVLSEPKPDLVFYNAGVDPHAEDRLGLLSLSDDGLLARDRMVAERVMALGLPLCGVLGGGYSKDVEALAGRHAGMFRALQGASQRSKL